MEWRIIMIICYKCKKDITEVNDIGRIVRSHDGNDFCFCKCCTHELNTMTDIDISNMVLADEQERVQQIINTPVVCNTVDKIEYEDEYEDCSWVMDDLRDSYAFADEGIYPGDAW